jgi:hypothetical protein
MREGDLLTLHGRAGTYRLGRVATATRGDAQEDSTRPPGALEEAYRNHERIQRGFPARISRSQLDAARLVVDHATSHFAPIRAALADVHSSAIFESEQDLLYKHLFEDLTSALDYVAFDVVERWGTPGLSDRELRRVSFPHGSPDQGDAAAPRGTDFGSLNPWKNRTPFCRFVVLPSGKPLTCAQPAH